MLKAEDGRKLFGRVQSQIDSQATRRAQLVEFRVMLEDILREELGENLVYGLNLNDQILHISARPGVERPIRMAMHAVRKLANAVAHSRGKNPLDTPPEPHNDDYYNACAAMCDIIAHFSGQPIPTSLDQFLQRRALAAAPVVTQPAATSTQPPAPVAPPIVVTPPSDAPAQARPADEAQPLATVPDLPPGDAALPDTLPFLRLLVRKVKQEVKATPRGMQTSYTLLGISEEYDTVEVKLTEQFAEVGALAWQYATVHAFNLRKVTGAERQLTLTPESLIVLEPDYLADASDVAEAYKQSARDVQTIQTSAMLEPSATSEPLLIGSIVNACFDEIIAHPEADPDRVFTQALRQDHRMLLGALALRQTTTGLRERTHEHLATLRNVVREAIQRGAAFTVEPTFLSERYGVQGRLDALLEYASEPQRTDILELKSGKPPSRQLDGRGWSIWPAHEAQALCYTLLAETVFPGRTGSASILYSRDPFEPVRPSRDNLQFRQELLAARNRVVALAHRLQQGAFNLTELLPEAPPGSIPAFVRERVATLASHLKRATPLEQAYYSRMFQFVAREQWLAKVGVNPDRGAAGLAGLWRASVAEKSERFEIMTGLTPLVADDVDSGPELRLTRDPSLQETPNFREGDVAILYPLEEDGSSHPTRHQILKCAIRSISQTEVVVRLNNRRVNRRYFDTFRQRPWALEHDVLDSSFDRMSQSLTMFLNGKQRMKDILLGERQPAFAAPSADSRPDYLTNRQHAIVQRALAARDCYLIQGPPGAGKTSRVMSELVRRLSQQPSETVLLLAYTNRAVNEICDAIGKLSPTVDFIRLGSPSSAGDHKSHTLAASLTDELSLEGMGQRIAGARVVVSTALSFLGHLNLLTLKSFTTAIVDEASQLLDPHLVGILSHMERFILIGDHYQLPAVVAQSPMDTRLTDELPGEAALRQAGFTDLRMSLFERLWRRYEDACPEALGKLTEQGRMHEAVQRFPNQRFYADALTTLTTQQQAPAHFDAERMAALPPSMRPVAEILSESRLVFIPTTTTATAYVATRSDATEVARVVALVRILRRLYGAAYQPNESIGVISPWRAQVAAIRTALDHADLDVEPPLVDTVERYQGSERDVVIISFATSSADYLHGVTDLWRGAPASNGASDATGANGIVSSDAASGERTVDRKLNVALTRAREQVILLGRLDVLSAAEGGHYSALFEHISFDGAYFLDNDCAVLDRLAVPVAAPNRT